ncbi:unnamed protein product [Rotaria socialis]|uniref:Uncharacterized protein n=1 Tax=Rotaria socialis TaxID=392032 RepID=A0A818QTN6_9BILA|nr:unnamed protein product [Rotaria socialis]CAF3386544.1 unnamed protein product [Rotaria socialis]CAF3646597.1 unnamed protein product [Rotaria socialis]CAF3704999.1 unnamed protein product [Rotaria socialis]CAF4389470.1 unnamed protein product [Rotaria socialis]
MVISLHTAQLAVLSAAMSEDSCEFYELLEMMVPCGASGYVNDFAYKYCEAYLDERDNFIDKKWQNGVRTCLQRSMLSKLQSNPGASCAQIRTWGFNSHLGCYMRPIPSSPEVKFCRLPSKDIIKISRIAIGEVIEREVRGQFAKMVKECAGQYLQDVNQDFVNFLKKTMASINWPW